jgi:hypothetical protein
LKRLGEEFEFPLFLSRFDEFNNPVKFMKMPSNVNCKLSTIDGEPLNIRTTIKNGPTLTDDQSSLLFQVHQNNTTRFTIVQEYRLGMDCSVM